MMLKCAAPGRAGVAGCAVGRQAPRASPAVPCAAAPRAAAPRPLRGGRCSRPQQAVAVQGSTVREAIDVEVEKTSWSSRRLYASVNIDAPVEVVWDALTDYSGLGTFIPSLMENQCLERRKHGALLRQVGAQDVAMGVKFTASCTLECTEFLEGVPASFCSASGSGADGLLPTPRFSRSDVETRDITFVQTGGDFEAFRGVWRVQPGASGGDSTLLNYALFVQPQAWLPVRLIQSRITGEVSRNLAAVRVYSEELALARKAGSATDSSYQR